MTISVLPSQKRRHSMPEYPWPERRGARIFLRLPDGREKEVDVLTATLQAQAWMEAVAGLACYQATSVIPALKDAPAKER